MNRSLRRLLPAAALAAALAAADASACGPFFPISYLSPWSVAGTFTNVDVRESFYDVRINVRHELDLLGRHFFPEWAGRELRHVPMSSEDAHRADYLEAAAAAGLAPAEAAAGLDALLAFAASAKESLQSGGTAAVPPAARPFEREFLLYALGRAQRLADETLAEPPAWLELLALPPSHRRFRTVWARHGLVLAAPDVATADRRLRELRADLDAGFRDTCGLEEAVVMQLLRRGGGWASLHWLPLAAAVRGSPRIEQALVADADWLRRGDEWYWQREAGGSRALAPSDGLRAAAAADPAAAETLVSLGLEDLLPDGIRGTLPVLCADRRAWVAFEEGDFERGRRLLSLAPTNSLVRLFWEARLARIDGDFARSAGLLRRWLAEAAARGGVPEGVFEVLDWDEGWLRDSDAENEPRTRSVSRVVEGELGAVLLTEGDFEEALLAFLRARSWIDAAFVAERCLTADALAAFVRAAPPETLSWRPHPWRRENEAGEALRWMAARRLLREGRPAEAGEFFPASRTADWAAYTNLLAAARPGDPPGGTDDARALASLNLARLLFARGMELLGTELEPDVHDVDGAYSISGVGAASLADLPYAGPRPDLPPLPEDRFHYRGLAIAAARRAAALAADPDVRAAALLLQGKINRISHDAPPKDAEPAYRDLCAIPGHPLADAARKAHWFPWNAASGFLGPLDEVREDPSRPFRALSLPELRAALRTPRPPDASEEAPAP